MPAQRTTALLSRCLVKLGPISPVPEEAVRSLTVGDREALLLHLRRLTLGEHIRCVLRCPDPGCGGDMEVNLKVGKLLQPTYTEVRDRYLKTVSQNGTGYRIRFRLPTGGDQEAVAALARVDLRAGAASLLARCIEEVTTEDGGLVGALPEDVEDGVASYMSELDPQAEMKLRVTCPDCANSFSAVLEAGDYLFQELQRRLRHLYREVHLLALYYHWSEQEILALSTRKRRLYLELLEEAFAGGGP